MTEDEMVGWHHTNSMDMSLSKLQELNQGLLHCRQILYQLGYQGSPT